MIGTIATEEPVGIWVLELSIELDGTGWHPLDEFITGLEFMCTFNLRLVSIS
jgi:hypothetical protein